MAPIDRQERRAQRMRGAGTTSVQASFGFNFGALGSNAPLLPQRSSRRTPQPSSAKQSSLPPQSSRKTPDTASKLSNGSTKRHRSASVQRSGSAKLNAIREYATPKLGKRKRGSKHAQDVGQDDGEADQLSPENEESDVRSIEKSRRVPAAQSPILEEMDDAPDELSVVDNMSVAGSVPKEVPSMVNEITQETPVPKATRKRLSGKTTPNGVATADQPQDAPTLGEQGTVTSTLSATTPVLLPNTPILLRPDRRPRTGSAGPSRLSQVIRLDDVDDGSEDELSPPQPSSRATPSMTIAQKTPSQVPIDPDTIDELSPEQATPIAQLSTRLKPRSRDIPDQALAKPSQASKSSKRPKTRKIVEEGEEEEEEERVQKTPQINKPQWTRRRTPDEDLQNAEDAEVDELSPELDRAKRQAVKNVSRRPLAPVAPPNEASPDVDETMDVDEEETELTPRPAPKPKAPKTSKNHEKAKQRTKPPSDEPPKKKQRREKGPSETISIMRLKGFAVKGLTVVDTTRTIVSKLLDQRLQRFVDQKNNARSSSQAKEAKRSINHVLAYRDNFEERILELQDANGSLNLLHSKDKQYKREARVLREEYLNVQKQRDELALETDDILYGFEQDKTTFNERQELSANMYEIQAAIREGKEKARAEGRENEGPEMPLKMLLDDVSKNAGRDGGMLQSVKNFNGVLQRAAGWLEGRA
ncbi:hypothetical protein BDV96DRAFT_583931 [Lophiotrema nucula]|uniref:Inner kinetochore subunit AME1 domain-containing protein n=1 Tax=Lophiotrema nucula TaxID=690887 RepID=A0A6A5YTV5_9PLEO|nr:hypothetical protein BDV96DRAFT_583931 [Lophiotrema nucula]